MGVYDDRDNVISEKFEDKNYWFWSDLFNGGSYKKKYISEEMKDYPAGTKYYVRPILKNDIIGTIKASPETEFTVPKPMTLDLDTPLNSITLPKATSFEVAINDGWGEYSAHSSTSDICDAEIVTVNDKPHVKLTTSKYMTGPATITVKDLRSEETEVILVTVSNDDFPKLALSEQRVSMQEDGSTTIEITSGSGIYTFGDYDDAVVTVTLDGEKIKIDAVGPGTTSITVTDKLSGETKSIEVTVEKTDIPAEPIDLGLPSGTLWASYNVGATAPEEYGSYFAWGETEEKDKYYFTNYTLSDGTVSSCHDIGEDISGTEYDVAHVRWEGEWQMPTKDDFQELVYKCEYKEDTQNGVKGYRFTGPNGNYIFLPYTGYYWDTENSDAGTEGSYWSATQTTSVNKAHEMSFNSGRMLWDCYINRFAGLSVRPVIHQEKPVSVAEPIDLGLPSGTLWASFNMGASKPEEYGDYYAWGETETKNWYGWDSYIHCDGSKNTCHDIGIEISGTNYDVAHVTWGGSWQLPTKEQIDELTDNCQHEMTTLHGVTGTLVTGPNGKTIFLPCAGFMSGNTLYGPEKYGLYKSGTRCGEDDLKESWLLNADADGFVRVGIWNSTGHSVRPVIAGNN